LTLARTGVPDGVTDVDGLGARELVSIAGEDLVDARDRYLGEHFDPALGDEADPHGARAGIGQPVDAEHVGGEELAEIGEVALPRGEVCRTDDLFDGEGGDGEAQLVHAAARVLGDEEAAGLSDGDQQPPPRDDGCRSADDLWEMPEDVMSGRRVIPGVEPFTKENLWASLRGERPLGAPATVPTATDDPAS
jgi:hypothetical protein